MSAQFINSNTTVGLDTPDMRTFVQMYSALAAHEAESILGWLGDPVQPWKGRDKQETLLRLFAFLRLIPQLVEFDTCVGNFNAGTVAPARELRDLFYTSGGGAVNIKDSGDVSDLTGLRGTAMLVTTSKNRSKYTVGQLDVEKIMRAFAQPAYANFKMRMCVVVPCRDVFRNTVNRARSTSSDTVALLRADTTIVLDWADLDAAYRRFKAVYAHRPLAEVFAASAPRPALALRPHQLLAIEETAAICTTGAREAVWGHVPRSGKSYVMAAYIARDALHKNKCNYLVITTAPNETLDQYESVLRCADLAEFSILRLPRDAALPLGVKNIVICSKQYLQSKFDEAPAGPDVAKSNPKKIKPPTAKCGKSTKNNGTRSIQTYFTRVSLPPVVVVVPALAWLAALKFEIRFVDESHLGGATDLARQTLACFGANAFTIYVTATYAKPTQVYAIPRERCVAWDLDDIAAAKQFADPDADVAARARARIADKHPASTAIFAAADPVRVAEIYAEYPELTILTRKLTPEVIIALRDAPGDVDTLFGWSPKACLLLKQSVVNKKVAREPEFQNKAETLKMVYAIFGAPRDDFGRPTTATPSFMDRARTVCDTGNADARFMRDPAPDVDPTVVVAFLPADDINTVSIALKALIERENALPEYDICIINSIQTPDPKGAIVAARARAKNAGKRAVLVLSGRQCSLGVTIPGCDVVVLLNSGGTNADKNADGGSDMVYQMMFRGMTEAPGKKFGFVFDLDIHRALRAVMANQPYGALTAKLNQRQTVAYLLRERIVSLNPDHWEPRFGHGGGEAYFAQVYEAYTARTDRAIRDILETMSFKSDMLSRCNCALLKAFVTVTRKGLRVVKALVARTVNADASVSVGIEKIATVGDAEKAGEDDDEEDAEENSNEDCITPEEIAIHLVPILSLITIHDTTTSLRHMLDLTESNPEMMEVLMDRTRAWWGDAGTAENIRCAVAIFEKHMACDISQVAAVDKVKDLFVQNLNNAAELSRIIDEVLVPLESEKKAHAEVSTPATLRKAMLDKIPAEFWTFPRKVLEPCAGKGGFLVDILERFMRSLEPMIPDIEERRRVIVEDCLYWADINPFNVLVCRLLLNPAGVYNTRGFLGDSLALDTNKEWGIAKFDAVVGNPPYNSAGSTGTGNTIWQKFVRRSLGDWIDASGLLVFVHPPGWRKPNTAGGKYTGLFDFMTSENYMQYLEIHNVKDGLRMFGCGTRYDWYVIQKAHCEERHTIVCDETQFISNVCMNSAEFLPNSCIDLFMKVIAQHSDIRCDVLYSRSAYGCDKPHMSYTKTSEHMHPCIHATLKDSAIRYMYSSITEHGHFKESKLIFGQTGYVSCVPDVAGEFGVTDNAIAIRCADIDECRYLQQALESGEFRTLLRACSWSNFRIDWRFFAALKKEFWREFV